MNSILLPDWNGLYEETRPDDPHLAVRYLQALEQLSRMKKGDWYREWFRVEKPGKPGQFRNISWAGSELGLVHYVLTNWLNNTLLFRHSRDYCYTGKTV